VVSIVLKDDIINEIVKIGFPVISVVDFADQYAIIYVDENRRVYVDGYGAEFLEEGVVTTTSVKQFEDGSIEMSDLTDIGLLNVLHGSRSSDPSWKDDVEYVKDYGWVK
jgi:hypothetical protein